MPILSAAASAGRRRSVGGIGRGGFPVATALCLAVTGGCGHTPSPRSSATAVTVVAERPTTASSTATVKVEPRAWQATVRSQGGLVADELTVIGARVAGRIADVAVEVGQRVQADDVLLQLDDTELQLRVVQSAAELARARAALGLDPTVETDPVPPQPREDRGSAAAPGTEVPPSASVATADPDTIDIASAPEVVRERARLEEARAQLERLEALADRNAVSRSDLDAGIAAVAVAEATLATAMQGVEEKLAVVRVQRAQLALARETCAQAVVRAPFDGLVQSRHGSAPGASVRVGDALVTLVRTDPLRFRGTIPERHALELREGQPVTVRLDGVPMPIHTHVARIAPLLDEMSRTLLFEADIPNPEGQLRSGLFAEADVVIDAEAQALVVPASSVIEFAGTEKVWLFDPGHGAPRGVPVRTGRRSEGLVEIVAGLSLGDLVVQHADLVQHTDAAAAVRGTN
jgi:RND family efflux transporter MFP subunit